MTTDILDSVHLLERGKTKMLFHDESGSFFQVSEQLFLRIREAKANRDLSLPISVLEKLLDYTDKAKLNRRPKIFKKMCRLRLEISNKCNNRCLYCHVFKIAKSRPKNDFMSFEDADRHIGEYLKLTQKYDMADAYYINFYGGEPLLAWNTIRKLISKYGTEYQQKEIVWGINTNGRLLNNEIMRFLRRNNVEIHMGCDGPREINDKVRRSETNGGTFDDIQKALDLANKHTVHRQLDSVISAANIDNLKSIVDLAKLNNVATIYLDLLYKPGGLYKPLKTIEAYKNAVEHGKKNGVAVGGCCTNIVERINEGRKYSSFNKYDFIRSIIVSVDGGIYPSLSRSEPVTYGSMEEYFSEENESWSRNYKEIHSYFTSICKDCFLKKYCYFSGIIQYQYHTKLSKGYEDSCNYLKEYVVSEFTNGIGNGKNPL